MSQKIITLSKQLANQIAAGEVVERPLSVVKELVENSLDAGATLIEIHLKNGGIDEITVKDNGEGIPENDLVLALEKYSTSKITTIEDLYEVMTFGFRGEALASIASVSEFSIASKTADSVSAKQICCSGGENLSEKIVAHEVGTSIQVSNLFFNTPARLAYLKKPRTEYLKTQEFIQKIALIYPNIGISLHHDDTGVYNFPVGQSIQQRIYEIFGGEFSENMRNISHEFSGIRVSGYITDPKISFKNKNRQLLCVNKRVIGSPMISKAIYDAYNRFIPHGTQPGYILSIDIDPTQVDVNVHPRKLEVRFAGESNIFRSVYHAIKDELERVSLVSPHSGILSPLGEREAANKAPLSSKGEDSGEREQYYTGSGTKFKNYSPYKNISSNPDQGTLQTPGSQFFSFGGEDEATNRQGNAAPFSPKGERIQDGGSFGVCDLRETPLGRIVGQVHNSYIVVETPSGLQILDQHALAERVIYERLASSSYEPKIQGLLGGIGMHLIVSEIEILETYMEDFENMGFEIEILSNNNILISSIPDFMSGQNIEKAFQKILSDISGVGSLGLEEVRHKIWAYTACRSAVKFGDPLSIFEINKLLFDAAIDYSATCPHGRPVVYDISLDELLGKYER